MKKITVSNVVSLFYFLDAGRPVTGIFTFYILYIFCAFMSRLFTSSIYVFHLWALHIYVYLLLAHMCVLVFCLCFYVCVLLNVNISGGENLHTVNILVENDTLAVLDSTVDGISRKDR